jgi:hypothetical protein
VTAVDSRPERRVHRPQFGSSQKLIRDAQRMNTLLWKAFTPATLLNGWKRLLLIASLLQELKGCGRLTINLQEKNSRYLMLILTEIWQVLKNFLGNLCRF